MHDRSYDAATRLFDAGRYVDLVAQCGTDDVSLAPLSPEHRLLVARALTDTDAVRAAAIAQRESRPGTTPTLRAQCELIAGLVERHHGAYEGALVHLRGAVRLAREARDERTLAWTSVQTFRLLAEVTPGEAAAALGETRAAVTRAADPHALAFLHDTITLLEASAGRHDQAWRHNELAASLLAQHPNAWLSQLSQVSASCIALLECDYAAAARYVRAAKQFLPITGSQTLRAIIENNEAHVLLFTGRFVRAEQALRKVVETTAHVPLRLAAFEGLARLYLALDRLEECERALAELEAARAGEGRIGPGLRHTALTRVKLLLRRGLWSQAQHIARDELARIDPVNASHDVAALSSVLAEAAAVAEQPGEASRALLAASERGGASLPDRQAEFFYSMATALDRAAGPVAARMRARAHAIWKQQGHKIGPLENARVSVSRDESDAKGPLSAQLQGAAVTDALAAAIDLAHRPRLLGAELLHVIETLGCSPNASIQESNAGARPGGDCYLLELGDDQGTPVALACHVPDDPFKAMLLSSVLRLGRAAVALERSRQEAGSRAALWPVDGGDLHQDAFVLSEEMRALFVAARRIAPTKVPVLITGETGTGKEVLARAIHAYSGRKAGTFVPFNCAAVPREMIDAQLFGHRKGAFTGATDSFSGVIRAAHRGTLLLDEIGDVGLDAQPKLLRFLESGEVHPIGEAKPLHADSRVLAATNVDLGALVAQGRFRDDLFYRLNVVHLHVPPLRERRIEIPALAQHYLQQSAQEYGTCDLRFAEETIEYLVLYRWPGNIRQLANEMRRLAALAESGAVLMPEHLSGDIAACRRPASAEKRELADVDLTVRIDQPLPAAVQHLERAMIQHALEATRGNMREAAKKLGLSRKGLYLKRQRLDLEEAALLAVGASPGARHDADFDQRRIAAS